MPQGYLKVGTTSSGKPIYVSFVLAATDQMEEVLSEFTDEEFFESYAVFQYLLMREYRLSGEETSQTAMYKTLSARVKDVVTCNKKWQEIRAKKGIHTSIDVINFGETLVSSECKG